MKKKQIFLIVGRSGVGKSSIVKAVCDITGMTCVKSYTTRPKREDEKDHTDHIFISEEEVEKYRDDMAAWTEIEGNQYFTTKEILNNADFYIIDPAGVQKLKNTCWNEFGFQTVYIRTSQDKALERTKERGNYSFEDRKSSENEQFTDFEKSQSWDYHLLNNGSFEEGVEKMLSIIKRAKEAQ